ncbi:hypothetical protein P879_10640 [Paragonimus westermani]|uniref:Uncharacterized protein n=1 Tax=Paragonimus westermani TaxID=34504 RepID=A0A8T0D604_9TREM|nr:hypothetical protein P879_10640 [Paragonimus westermani]
MGELLMHPKEDSCKWIEVDRLVSESVDGRVDSKPFCEIFAGYRCTVDLPSWAYYPQLMQVYPESKTGLRLSERMVFHKYASHRDRARPGQGEDTSNEGALLAGYEDWIDRVKGDVPSEKLLESITQIPQRFRTNSALPQGERASRTCQITGSMVESDAVGASGNVFRGRFNCCFFALSPILRVLDMAYQLALFCLHL